MHHECSTLVAIVRAAVETEGNTDPAAAAWRALEAGAEEVVVLCDGALDARTIASLRALSGIRVRVSIATFDQAAHARLGLPGDPRVLVRSLAQAAAGGLPVDVVLPIGEGLGPVAGRLHGLARAAPKVARYLLSPVPDDVPPLQPAAIDDEVAAASAAAQELGVALSTDDDTRIDTELQAVLAGIKPVIRLSTEGTDERTLRARYAGFGLVACAADGTFIDDRGEHGRALRLVYVAQTMETAEHVRDVEAKTFAPRTSVEARQREYHDLGVALGYPRCCVDAYVERVIGAPRSPHGPLAEAYLAASGAWDASPAWQLNHLLFETGDALITFTPCSYRCAAALDYATRVLAEVERMAPLAGRRLRRRLAVDVAVDRSGARVLVQHDGARIVAARPRRAPNGAYVHALDAALARRLLSATTEDPPPIVLRFGVSC
jgi:hypothetical protein